MNKPLVIDYYTDILCVWGWIAQRRIDELNQKLGDKIAVQYYCVDVFGDVPSKINAQWQGKSGYEGFADHVRESALAYEDAFVNPKIWREVRPVTSANAHLMLKAIEIACGKNNSVNMALSFRRAFFRDALDIANLDVLFELVASGGLDRKSVSESMQDGSAMAVLMHDYQQSRQQGIKGSPSYVIDGGRQTLYGNVGYRVLMANIEELLKRPADEASWC